ncbi:fatty acid desaturase family protein [Oleiharenicola lentus]|uniref:fatty acid desaturase family protein n=1 Tax=Oleiharenicola lentus TaxID=2508720 RepID=UPI003F66D8C7
MSVDRGAGRVDARPVQKTGTELILATKPYAKDNALHSWWAIISTTLLLLAALGGALLNVHWPARLACSILAGLLLLRLFVIYHDQQHHAILPRSKLAEGFMRVFGIYALSASSVWRSSHNHHHQHNSKLRGAHIGSFPIMTKDQYRKSSRAKRFGYLFIRHPATILFGYFFMFLFGMCLNPFLNNPRKHYDCLISLIVHAGITVALFYFGGWQAWLFAQAIPHFITYAIGTYFFYAQHNFPGVSFTDKDGWTYEKAALESSSYMRMGPIMRWFSANIGYHHIHHLNHKIPFYRLPEVLREIPELQAAKTTSLWPADIFRCLRLKVWDVETQRMVGVRGL